MMHTSSASHPYIEDQLNQSDIGDTHLSWCLIGKSPKAPFLEYFFFLKAQLLLRCYSIPLFRFTFTFGLLTYQKLLYRFRKYMSLVTNFNCKEFNKHLLNTPCELPYRLGKLYKYI